MDRCEVVIVRPPYHMTEFDQVSQEPVGLEYVVASLRKAGFATLFLDCEFLDLSVEDVLLEIEEHQPKLVGLSVMGRRALIGAVQIAEGVKRWAAPDATVVVGGHFPSFVPELVLKWAKDVDAVARFEGEHVAPALAAAAGERRSLAEVPGLAWRNDGRVIYNASPRPVLDLDELPWPARDVLPAGLRLGRACSVSSSRGCIGQCAFCTIPPFYRGAGAQAWRARDPVRVVDEIEYLQRAFDVRDINFIDDDFIGRPGIGWTRARSFAQELLRRRIDVWYEFECRPDCLDKATFEALRASGLQSVFIGVETVVGRSQALFRKRLSVDSLRRNLEMLRSLGIVVHVGYILFHPLADPDDIAESLEFLSSEGIANVHTLMNAMVVDHGSPILDRLVSCGFAKPTPDGAFSCDFADRRVAALFAVVRVALRPVFPFWYAALRRQAQIRTAIHAKGKCAELQAELQEAQADERACDYIAETIFRRAMDQIRRRIPADLCGFALQLRQEATDRCKSLSAATQALSLEY